MSLCFLPVNTDEGILRIGEISRSQCEKESEALTGDKRHAGQEGGHAQ